VLAGIVWNRVFCRYCNVIGWLGATVGWDKMIIQMSVVLALVAISATVGVYLPTFLALDFFAILLTVIAGQYVGFSFADGRPDKIALELGFALLLCACVLLGMWKWTWLIPVGYLLLCGWSVWHHYFYLTARVKAWFAKMCALYCGFITLFIYVHFFY